MTATGKLTDAEEPYQMSYAGALTVRQERVAHYRDYRNPPKALDASFETPRT